MRHQSPAQRSSAADGRAPVLASDDQCDDVEVLGGPLEELGEEQTAATDHCEIAVWSWSARTSPRISSASSRELAENIRVV